MNTEIIENMKKTSKSTYDVAKELYNINTKTIGQVYEQQMALLNLSMECTTAQMKQVGQSKDYKELISNQTSLVNEVSEKAQGIARNSVDIINESKDEINAWMGKSIEDIAAIVPVGIKTA